jgi:regulator of protease activity HflC (stomatin/prohibitin superfamily)
MQTVQRIQKFGQLFGSVKRATQIVTARTVSSQQKRTFLTTIQENCRGVRLAWGKFDSILSPGLNWDIPFYHKITTIGLSRHIIPLAKQKIICQDNVTIFVDSAVEYQIIDARKAIIDVSNIHHTILEKCQMKLSNELGSKKFNDIQGEKNTVSENITKDLAVLEEDWGVKIYNVQIKDISFEESMTRTMATQADAERQAAAKIIHAKADVQVAAEYEQASKIYKENPISLRLREFQLWSSVSKYM